MNLDYSYSSSGMLPIEPIPVELPSGTDALEIIAQPCYTSKVRYRSDFKSNKNRRGVLHSRNNPNYQYPAIRIPQQYLKTTNQLYIRICLVTVLNERTKCRYIHPYDLENIDVKDYNDQNNKAVWFPIQREDIDGIKSFPKLRIVKKTAEDLKNYGDFRVFDSVEEVTTPQLPVAKDTIKEFNLDKAQLAFSVGEKIIANNIITAISYSYTTVFSDEMIEITGKDSDIDDAPSESTTIRSHSSRSSGCRMYKYAPQNAYTNTNDEVLIFYTNHIKPKKYGELEVTFECDTANGRWSESVLDLQVKDQMVSFRTPCFPFFINTSTPVDIILKQKTRVLEPLKFHYIAMEQCPTCQRNAIENPHSYVPHNPKKRRISNLFSDEDEAETISFDTENNPALQESETSSVSTTLNSVSLLPIKEDPTEQVLNILADSIASLFFNGNFMPILRFCRPFIRKRPELLHGAIGNNNSNVVLKFILIAPIDLLRQKNEFGETVLLHAARLNRIDIVKALLEKENSDQLLKDTNSKGQNIFHILALNTNSNEILDLFIQHLLENSLDISETFDYVDEDNHTPLQLAIWNDNTLAAQHLLKYFRNDLPLTSNHATDDVVQNAVRYIDLIKFI